MGGRGETIPLGAKALIGNPTVTGATGPGYLVMYPTAGTVPSTSSINYVADSTIANGVIVGLNANGKATIQCAVSATHVIVDVSGFVY